MPLQPAGMELSTYFAVAFWIAALFIVALLSSNYTITFRLRHIPTIGHSFPILSYFSGLRFVTHAKDLFQEGYNKYKGGIFKIPMMDQWFVVVTGPKLIEEIRKMPDDHVSLPRALAELMAGNQLFGEHIVQDQYYLGIIHEKLSKNLAEFTPMVREEMFQAFDDLIHVNGDEWKSFPALSTIVEIIARTSNRVFVGSTYCRDPEFMDLAKNFTLFLAKARFIINMFHPWLKPVVASFVNTVPRCVARGLSILRPAMEERQQFQEEYGKEWQDKPNDVLMWLMDAARTRGYGMDNVVTQLLLVEFAAIHSTAMSLTHALYHLAAQPEFAEPMRKEIESVLSEEGELNKAAVGKLYLVDSFLRESQRVNGVNAVAVWRKVMKDITFSDGTTVPAGTFMAAASVNTHLDDEIYECADVFQPFRFINGKSATTQSLVTTSTEFLSFGHGKHACPGRNFASFEMKLMLSYILLNFDVKLADGQRPKNYWIGATILPDRTAHVLFRKRHT